MTVKVEHLTGGYGKRPVIENINFELKKGEIVGLIGLNGAGKSTTIKHMLGLLTPMEGTLSISDTNINDDIEIYRRKLSYIPESPVIYEELTLEEHIIITFCFIPFEKWLGKTLSSFSSLNVFSRGRARFIASSLLIW